MPPGLLALASDSMARWQFASTTIYHFIFVPVSIGLGLLVATMQTVAYRRRGTPDGTTWDRASRFFGKLLLISFAIGVVTGIVQEFQFGMNWSEYSRFVGNIFGAPLAMEGLVAFFLESTFLGLWIYGRGLLSARLHLATIWCASLGSAVSAYFILAANSWMQHPVGYRIDPRTRIPVMTDIAAVLFQRTQLVTFAHVILSALLTGGAVLLSVVAWHHRRSLRDGTPLDPVMRKVAAMALGVVLVGAVAVSVVGDQQAQVMVEDQPMKMAAAEALWNTRSHASFSLFAVGNVAAHRNAVDVDIPDGLSLLATHHPSGVVEGINQVAAAERASYGPGDYVPVVGLAYWSFRLMIGFGALAGVLALLGLLQWWRGRLAGSGRLLRAMSWAAALPILANTAGWLFTETARQPWLVYGLLRTGAGVSPNVSNALVGGSLAFFVLLYGALGAVAVRLLVRASREGPDPVGAEPDAALVAAGDGLLALAPLSPLPPTAKA